MRKFIIITIITFTLTLTFTALGAFCAEVSSLERDAMILRVELNRLGSDGDPLEREAILREIIDTCKGTEEAEAAYWDLADLYLDAFPEERRQEACEMLELCLKNYPETKRSVLVKCKLVELYDKNNARRAELITQIKNDKSVPKYILEGLN
ncbi:MAG: hypothetical protein IJT58_03240 [Synergistaceae bacterium]|nr:hypothetical protein [Synergistaceae bacterium]